jgi:hypothetical protein
MVGGGGPSNARHRETDRGTDRQTETDRGTNTHTHTHTYRDYPINYRHGASQHRVCCLTHTERSGHPTTGTGHPTAGPGRVILEP